MTDSPFDPSLITKETMAINRAVIEALKDYDPWAQPIAETRAIRARGDGPFPRAPSSERAQTVQIDGAFGSINLRIIAPDRPLGAYLHIHGGGWVFGAADAQDPRLEHLADACGLACVSVEYSLAPEHPFPAALDDCEAAALWLFDMAMDRFGTDRLFIGGESAGAHLSVLTLLRLRDRDTRCEFIGADLNAGMYDLSMTPSVRNARGERLILNRSDIERFVSHFVPTELERDDPSVSPIFADLHSLPPAIFTVGTNDPLLDDSLFMAKRWEAAGNRAELTIGAGGAHVFTAFSGHLSRHALDRIDSFLMAL